MASNLEVPFDPDTAVADAVVIGLCADRLTVTLPDFVSVRGELRVKLGESAVVTLLPTKLGTLVNQVTEGCFEVLCLEDHRVRFLKCEGDRWFLDCGGAGSCTECSAEMESDTPALLIPA